MIAFKDVFISYGRKQSKHFATRLSNGLSEQGLEVWFDQNDIPLAVHFQDQIDDGIEKAHNFIFIISPHSVDSEYCRKEIELAIKWRKRIIPIMHVETGINWDNMHPVISELNWIYMKEEYEDGKPLEALTPIDDFDEKFQGLMTLLCDDDQKYVKTHTKLLNAALNWERKQRLTEHLLVGEERTEAEKWLVSEVPGKISCAPTTLHAEYVTESKKNANNLMTDVFVSYADENRGIREQVIESLALQGITAWLHNKDKTTGIEFENTVFEGIEKSDSFLFFISKSSVNSEWCMKELEYALNLNKRVIPLLIEHMEKIEIPEMLNKLQPINFVDKSTQQELKKYDKTGFDRDLGELFREIKLNKEYYSKHKTILVQALKWQRNEFNPSFLLRGFNLEQAKTWLETGSRRTSHLPLKIHKDLIDTSHLQKGQLHTEVFISYSRKDGDFARKLNDALQLNGKTTWFDQESIGDSTTFQDEIYKGIEQANNFLFIISPDAVNSSFCADEVAYAEQQGKRFITIWYRETNLQNVPETLKKIQWINFNDDGFEKSFSTLIREIDIDREHAQAHTRWLQKSLEWKSSNESKDLLLRGVEIDAAKSWLEQAETEHKNPAPTDLQKRYINNSLHVEQQEQQSQLREHLDKLDLLLLEEKQDLDGKRNISIIMILFLVVCDLSAMGFDLEAGWNEFYPLLFGLCLIAVLALRLRVIFNRKNDTELYFQTFKQALKWDFYGKKKSHLLKDLDVIVASTWLQNKLSIWSPIFGNSNLKVIQLQKQFIETSESQTVSETKLQRLRRNIKTAVSHQPRTLVMLQLRLFIGSLILFFLTGISSMLVFLFEDSELWPLITVVAVILLIGLFCAIPAWWIYEIYKYLKTTRHDRKIKRYHKIIDAYELWKISREDDVALLNHHQLKTAMQWLQDQKVLDNSSYNEEIKTFIQRSADRLAA